MMWPRRRPCPEARRTRNVAERRLREAYAREQVVAEVSAAAASIAAQLTRAVRDLDQFLHRA